MLQQRVWTSVHLIQSDGLRANKRRRPPHILVLPSFPTVSRYLSVRLCPSQAASSLSPAPHPPFICLPPSDYRSPIHPSPDRTPNLSALFNLFSQQQQLFSLQSATLWHFVKQSMTKYWAEKSTICCLFSPFNLSCWNYLVRSPSCATFMRAIRATLSCWSARASGLRDN